MLDQQQLGQAIQLIRQRFGVRATFIEVDPRTRVYPEGQFFVLPDIRKAHVYGQGNTIKEAVTAAVRDARADAININPAPLPDSAPLTETDLWRAVDPRDVHRIQCDSHDECGQQAIWATREGPPFWYVCDHHRRASDG